MLEFKITIHGRASSPDMADVDLIAALATVMANTLLVTEDVWARVETRQSV